jgi:hypothetical protein
MTRTPDNPKPQADKFRDLARELEADEDEAAFEETVKKIVQAPKADEKDVER